MPLGDAYSPTVVIPLVTPVVGPVGSVTTYPVGQADPEIASVSSGFVTLLYVTAKIAKNIITINNLVILCFRNTRIELAIILMLV